MLEYFKLTKGEKYFWKGFIIGLGFGITIGLILIFGDYKI